MSTPPSACSVARSLEMHGTSTATGSKRDVFCATLRAAVHSSSLRPMRTSACSAASSTADAARSMSAQWTFSFDSNS